MKKARFAILLANLGTPEVASSQAVRAFLKPFLSDKRVVEMPRVLWWPILHGAILPFRPAKVAKKYQALWPKYGDSPLRFYTRLQVAALKTAYDDPDILVDYVFTYGQPSLETQLDQYRERAEKIIILPLFAQYSATTTAALADQLAHYQLRQRFIADVSFIRDYYQAPSFIAALEHSVREFWQQHGQGDFLLMSYHGIPEAYVKKGDAYAEQCLATSRQLAQALCLDDSAHQTSFQSRLGRAKWLTPYTCDVVAQLAKQGVKTLDVICPSFAVDCLETLEEIRIENRAYFCQAGGVELRLIPCLNADEKHIAMMQALIEPYLR